MSYALLFHLLHASRDIDAPRGTLSGTRARDVKIASDGVEHSGALAADQLLDRTIVERLRQGDSTALGALMQRYFDRMGRLATHLLGSRDAADDVVQEVFVRVWERREALDAEQSINGFLLTAVRRRALNNRKYDRVREAHREAVLRVSAESDECVAGNIATAGDAEQEIEAMIVALPERQQTAIRLRYVEQLTVREIAQVLSISPNATHQLIFRALDTLRRLLSGREPGRV
jgi:RNA polymerase sigma factor (sigma-70 family)